MTKRELLRYVGDYRQLFGIKHYMLTNGRDNGVRAFDIRSGSGLEFTILQDRCLDLAALSFRGINCSYLSKTGIVSPFYYERDGNGFLRNFYSGMLTTCGLRNVGPSSADGEDFFTQHGRISNIAAEDVSAVVENDNESPVIRIRGTMREACVFGENLLLHREIICRYGENKIEIRNTVRNEGFRREALMLLFHFNVGYPLLDENAYLIVPSVHVTPRDGDAKAGIEFWDRCQKPTRNYREQVFYHDLKADSDGNTAVSLVNEKLGLGLVIRFNKNQLFNFTQWKQMGEGEYVMGLEPCNCFVDGRTALRNANVIDYMEPGEVRRFDLTIEILAGVEEIQHFSKAIK